MGFAHHTPRHGPKALDFLRNFELDRGKQNNFVDRTVVSVCFHDTFVSVPENLDFYAPDKIVLRLLY